MTTAQSTPRTKIHMLVFNACEQDARVLKEAAALTNAGYAVKIYAIQSDNPAVPDYEQQNGFEIVRVQINRWKKREAPPAGQQPGAFQWRFLLRPLYRLVKLTRFDTYLRFFNFHYIVAQMAQKDPAAVYHAHDWNTLIGARWAARRTGAKLVYDSHELYTERNRRKPLPRLLKAYEAWIEKRIIRQADAVITVNKSIAGELSNRYNIPQPYVVMNIPEYISTAPEPSEANRLRRDLDIPPERRILLYSGGITFNRGLEQTIESLQYLPDVHLVCLGYGTPDFKQALVELAQRTGVIDRFSFYGPVRPHEVTAYARYADVGVAAFQNVGLSNYYCSPNKLFEYLSSGIPAVVSDFPELGGLVKTYEVGLTFDPADPQDIARSVRGVLDAPAAYAQMKNNTANVIKDYRWENEAAALLNIYNKLVGHAH